MAENNLVTVPSEMVKIIPQFGGEPRLLSLFIKKSEYIIQRFQGNELQNEYLFHVITSRLVGEAAKLIGERDQIESWVELKTLLQEHFGDPRTEQCLVLELESLKINRGESYFDFCHRVQQLRSILIAKVNETIQNQAERVAKQNIYNNTSLNVFLYNLPAYLVRLVRLKNVTTLEDALKQVLEEENFQNVYNQKNVRGPRANNSFDGQRRNISQGANVHVSNRSFSNNNFSGPQQPTQMRNGNFNSGFVPNDNSFQMRNPNRFQTNNSFHAQNQGRPQMNNYNANISQRPPVYNTQQGAGSGCNTDVTMRTASSRRVNYTNMNNANAHYSMMNESENNDDESFHSSSAGNVVENFHIRAFSIGKK